jgi:hypothetical protein
MQTHFDHVVAALVTRLCMKQLSDIVLVQFDHVVAALVTRLCMKHLSDIVLVSEQSCWFSDALVSQNNEERGVTLHIVHKIGTCPSVASATA